MLSADADAAGKAVIRLERVEQGEELDRLRAGAEDREDAPRHAWSGAPWLRYSGAISAGSTTTGTSDGGRGATSPASSRRFRSRYSRSICSTRACAAAASASIVERRSSRAAAIS